MTIADAVIFHISLISFSTLAQFTDYQARDASIHAAPLTAQFRQCVIGINISMINIHASLLPPRAKPRLRHTPLYHHALALDCLLIEV